MPRYYFDIRDRKGSHQDDYGVECIDFEEARKQAQGILPHIAGEQLPDGEAHDFVCEVRCETGRIVYRAELTYRGTRLAAGDATPPFP